MSASATRCTPADSAPIGLIDWHDVHTGGMPAFERALRALEAGYLELADRLAAAQAQALTVAPTDAAGRIAVIDLLRGRPFGELVVQTLAGEES
jgi:hypothetical protein